MGLGGDPNTSGLFIYQMIGQAGVIINSDLTPGSCLAGRLEKKGDWETLRKQAKQHVKQRAIMNEQQVSEQSLSPTTLSREPLTRVFHPKAVGAPRLIAPGPGSHGWLGDFAIGSMPKDFVLRSGADETQTQGQPCAELRRDQFFGPRGFRLKDEEV